MSVKGNINSVKDGAYSRVPLSRMHPALEPVRRRVFRLRLALEGALVDGGGSISPLQACYLQTALTHEGIAQIWERRIRASFDEMNADQLAIATDRISRERDRRDAALAKLGLDRDQTEDIFDALYRDPPPALTLPSGPTGGDQGETAPGDESPGDAKPGGPASVSESVTEVADQDQDGGQGA